MLRNYLRNQSQLETKLASNLEYKYNFPMWMIHKLKHDYSKNYQEIISHLNSKPKLGIRVNPRKITQREYVQLLDNNEIGYNEVNGRIYLTELSNPKLLPKFEEGYVSVQDINAQKLIDFVDIRAGARVLDACSAPGGKACQLLENKEIDLTCLDIDSDRLDKLSQNLSRLSLTANIKCGNATKSTWWDQKLYDYIIADVPCSASGTMKKNPDIKYIRTSTDIANFVKVQRAIIDNLWQMLKPNGFLIYITCSIFPDENKNNINYVVGQHLDMQLITDQIMLPTDYADGFYYATLSKIKL